MKTNLNAAKKPSATRTGTRKIRNLTEELSREDYSLGMPLLDAAVAGVILGFKPSDREMRTQAQRCWELLKPRLNQHLLSEDETVLPWAESEGGISSDAMNRIKKRHREMRSLIGKLTGVSFEEDPDKVVAVAGKALCLQSRIRDRQRITGDSSPCPELVFGMRAFLHCNKKFSGFAADGATHLQGVAQVGMAALIERAGQPDPRLHRKQYPLQRNLFTNIFS